MDIFTAMFATVSSFCPVVRFLQISIQSAFVMPHLQSFDLPSSVHRLSSYADADETPRFGSYHHETLNPSEGHCKSHCNRHQNRRMFHNVSEILCSCHAFASYGYLYLQAAIRGCQLPISQNHHLVVLSQAIRSTCDLLKNAATFMNILASVSPVSSFSFSAYFQI